MHLGGLTTAGRYANEVNLTYVLFDNEQNKSTGGQNTYQSHLDYIGIAKNAGFNIINNTIKTLNDFKSSVKDISGLKFICVKCDLDEETPRPPLDVIKVNEFR